MEGCFGASNEGSVSPETLRRWIVKVDNVLGTPIGRKKFQDFLQKSDGFEEGLQLITFWEMCHEIVPDEAMLRKKRKKKTWFSSQKAVDESLDRKCKEILSYANENINLDAGLLQRIDNAISNKEYKEILSTIFYAKQETVLLLEKYHSLFKDNLLQLPGVAQST